MNEQENNMDEVINVLGEVLRLCGEDPVTGFYRDSYCNTCAQDVGSHTICIEANEGFLQYSRFKGNDLSTPIPEFGFKGLKPGDSWCLCAARWLEAYNDKMAPRVHLLSTHVKALEIVSLDLLKECAVDLN